MYGLIHSAARQMVLDQFGPEMWARVTARSMLGDLHFIDGEIYGDEVTFQLVGAISQEVSLPAEALLFEFGRYWVRYVSESAFGAAMRATGDDFVSFVGGLDRLHRSVRIAMPHARMPSFEVIETAPGRVEVLYVSERQGLEAFVAGLLQGLLERFGEIGSISHAPGADGVVFSVALRAREAA